MKYKRILAGAFALALTLPLLLPRAHAHPGRTDGNGGHTDSDTGDYHFHHGYPAHEHYDMDGDGDIDCPYDFDDQTGASSGESSSPDSDSDVTPHISASLSRQITQTIRSVKFVLRRLPSFSFPSKSRSMPIRIADILSEREERERTSQILNIAIAAFIITSPIALLSIGVLWQLNGRNTVIRSVFTTSLIISILPAIPIAFILFMISCIFGVVYALVTFFLDEITEIIEYHYGSSERVKPVSSPAPPPKEAPTINFRTILLPEKGVSPHTRCRDTCRYIWYETLSLQSQSTPPLSADACVYIWSALFYTVAKTVRSQDSVNRIYSYFDAVTGEFIMDADQINLIVNKIRDIYRKIRTPLNASGIDPRTANGRRDLWHFLTQYCAEFRSQPGLEKLFLSAAERIWKTTSDIFPQAHPYPKAGDVHYSIGESSDT